MDSLKSIAVVRGASGAAVQDLFHTLVERWRSRARLAGVIAEPHGLPNRTCSAGFLRNIPTGELFSIFADLGPGSEACHLDGTGARAAADAVCRTIAAGCDLVLLSKFGKLEARSEGLIAAFEAARDARVPLLTSVSVTLEPAWTALVTSSFVVLPANPSAIEIWWQGIRPEDSGPASHALRVHR
jgi:hypothetical protein